MDKIQELRMLFEKHDRDHLECDGATRVFSYLLKEREIEHTIMGGRLEFREPFADDSDIVEPHYWIELPFGLIVDYKARRWLPDREGVPHGIFGQDAYPKALYIGEPSKDFLVSKAIFDILLRDPNTNV